MSILQRKKEHDEERSATLCSLHVMDGSGHTTLTWDPTAVDKTKEKAALDLFREKKAEGYRADSLDEKGGGEVIHEFDPTAKETVMSPQLVGG